MAERGQEHTPTNTLPVLTLTGPSGTSCGPGVVTGRPPSS